MNLFAYYSRSFVLSGNDIYTTDRFRHVNNVCTVLSPRISIRGLVNGLNRGFYDGDLIRHISASWQNDRTDILLSSESTSLVKVHLPDCTLDNPTKRDICLEAARVIQSLLECGCLPLEYSAINEDVPRATRLRRSERPVYNPEPTIDREVLEDTFTCHTLVDRIKNCDTICSGKKKIKIIVREDDNKMMVTNVKFDNNTLIIDVDNVKMKECSYIKTGKGLYGQMKASFIDFNTILNSDIHTWSTASTLTYNSGTSASVVSNNAMGSF